MLGKKGTTILELLIAMILIASSVITISLVFPKAAKSITTNRQRLLAGTFASSRMQELTSKPYAAEALDPTDPGVAGQLFAAVGANDCSCGAATTNLGHPILPVDAEYIEDGIKYVRKVCINLVEGQPSGTWITHCPNNPLTPARDKGIKSIRIQVTWTSGSETFSTNMESMVNR